ncbi:MAG: Gx transporter family protein [Clostridia bacterium]|nr:Gx transporter family protein [Clostridia bacterium]
MWTSWRDNRVKRLSLDAALLALAMGLSYLEFLLPIGAVVPLPGFRLGLANLVVMLTFSLLSPLDAAVVSALRILLSGLLFGSATSLYFSALGGLCSYLVLLLLYLIKAKCSFIGISILSAAAHNCGQIIAAMTLYGVFVARSYLPYLLLASIFYGGLLGLLANLVLHRLQKKKEAVK